MTEQTAVVEAVAPATAEATAAPNQPIQGSAYENLVKFYESQGEPESAQVENSEEIKKTEEPEATEQVEGEAEKEAENAESADTSESDETETANFKALESDDLEFTDKDSFVDKLKERFPRQKGAFYTEVAKYAEQAHEGGQVIKSIGGKEFVPSVSTIATGLKEGDFNKVFTGVAEFGSDESVFNMANASMDLVINRAPLMRKAGNIEIADLLDKTADIWFQERFGEGKDAARLETLCELDSNGYIEVLMKLVNGEIDETDFAIEVDELKEKTDNPKLKSLAEENASLKKQLAEKPKPTETNDGQFFQSAIENISKVLNDVVWGTSPLRDLKDDSAELKAEKSFLRSNLERNAFQSFQRLLQTEEFKDLENDYKKGAGGTGKYKAKLTDIIGQAVLNTKTDTEVSERILAKLYGKTRNGALLEKQKQLPEKKISEPTQTTEFKPDQPKTKEQIQKELVEKYAAIP